MHNISDRISYDEATTSPTALRLGIDNTPDEYKLNRMRLVAEKCFEPLREWYGKPIKVNSFYRCRELNAAVKGSLTSQHILGEAIDLSAGSKAENKKLKGILEGEQETFAKMSQKVLLKKLGLEVLL